LDEDWEPDPYLDETNVGIDDEQQHWDQEREQRLVSQFVAHWLRDCLNTPIIDKKPPRVLFMAEAHNARKMTTVK
jgi:hypothetical protein